MKKKIKNIKSRLEYLREEIRKERISYSEIIELDNLKKYIEPGDIELLQWVNNEDTIPQGF
jgi:hypothetical protein